MTSFEKASEAVERTTTPLLEQLAFLPVPAGSAKIGLEQKVYERFVNSYGQIWEDFFCRETPQHEVNIPSFELSRFPVTNAIYAQFIADGGYDAPRYWTPDGWVWRKATNRTQPVFWNHPKFAGDDRPTVGVSWYEAMAVARWAALKTGYNIRLPGEAEWEWASRGTNTRSLYPWGGAWDPNKLNSGFSDVGSPNRGTTTPVGMFSPVGDGPFGHSDMLGQVWEWTLSTFKSYPYVATDGREDIFAPERRVLRGGNWSDGKYANRVTTRYLYPPNYADVSTGFRLALCGDCLPMLPRPRYDLVVYGRTTFCPDLVKAREWLHAWRVPYRQLNIDMDETAAARLDEWLGTRTIPTFVVAEHLTIDPITTPSEANLSALRNIDRGSMLHEPEEGTLRSFLVRNGFLPE